MIAGVHCLCCLPDIYCEINYRYPCLTPFVCEYNNILYISTDYSCFKTNFQLLLPGQNENNYLMSLVLKVRVLSPSLTLPLTHSLTHSLTHTHSLACSLTHSLTHSLNQSINQFLTLNHSLLQTLTHSYSSPHTYSLLLTYILIPPLSFIFFCLQIPSPVICADDVPAKRRRTNVTTQQTKVTGGRQYP